MSVTQDSVDPQQLLIAFLVVLHVGTVLGDPLLKRRDVGHVLDQMHHLLESVGRTLDRVLEALDERPDLLL